MTTIAIVAGMMPIAFGRGAGAGSRASMAVTILGGQVLCLLLTLLVTPVVYSYFDDLREWDVLSALKLRRVQEQRPGTLPSPAVRVESSGPSSKLSFPTNVMNRMMLLVAVVILPKFVLVGSTFGDPHSGVLNTFCTSMRA